jgi:Flp pilus assembly protein TadD
VAVVLYRRRSTLAFWIALFFVGLAPVSQIVPLVTLMNDRYLYFPMLGAAVVMATLLVVVYERIPKPTRVGVVGVAGGLVVVFAVLAFQRAQVWHDSVTLWSDAYRKNPPTAQTAYFLGQAYRNAGDTGQAITYYRQAMALSPSQPVPVGELAMLYLQAGQPEAALPLVQLLNRLAPGDVRALVAQGAYEIAVGDLARAEVTILAALRSNPLLLDAMFRLGQIYGLSGRLGEARAILLQVVQNGGGDPEVYFELASVEAARGASADALRYLRTAVQGGFHGRQRLLADPRLDHLRGTPEFRQLLAGE